MKKANGETKAGDLFSVSTTHDVLLLLFVYLLYYLFFSSFSSLFYKPKWIDECTKLYIRKRYNVY